MSEEGEGGRSEIVRALESFIILLALITTRLTQRKNIEKKIVSLDLHSVASLSCTFQ